MDGETMSAIAQCEAALAPAPTRSSGGGSGGGGGGGGGGPRLDGGILLDALIGSSAGGGGSPSTPLRAKRPAFGGLTIRLPASAADAAPAGGIFPHIDPPTGGGDHDTSAAAAAAAAAASAAAVRVAAFEGDWLDFCSDGMPGALDEVPPPPPAVAPPPPPSACGLDALSWAAGAVTAWAGPPTTPASSAPMGGGGWAAAAAAAGRPTPSAGPPSKATAGGEGKAAPAAGGPCLPVSPLTPRANDPDAILDDAADCGSASGGARGCVSPFPFPSLNSPHPSVGGWPSATPAAAPTPVRPSAADVAAARRKARMSARRGAAAGSCAAPVPATASLDSMDFEGGDAAAPATPHPSSGGLPPASPSCGGDGAGGAAPPAAAPGRPVDKKAARAMRNREAALRSRLAAKARLASLEAEHAALSRRVATAAARVGELKGRGRELLAGLGPIDGLVGADAAAAGSGVDGAAAAPGGDAESTTSRLAALFRDADADSGARGAPMGLPPSPLPPAAMPF